MILISIFRSPDGGNCSAGHHAGEKRSSEGDASGSQPGGTKRK